MENISRMFHKSNFQRLVQTEKFKNDINTDIKVQV